MMMNQAKRGVREDFSEKEGSSLFIVSYGVVQ